MNVMAALVLLAASDAPGDNGPVHAAEISFFGKTMAVAKMVKESCPGFTVDYRDERCSGFHPSSTSRICTKQQLGEDHAPDFRPGAGDFDKRLENGGAHASESIGLSVINRGEPCTNPADEVAITDVANEKPQTDRGLGKRPLSCWDQGDGAADAVMRCATQVCRAAVSASVKSPSTTEARASRIAGRQPMAADHSHQSCHA